MRNLYIMTVDYYRISLLCKTYITFLIGIQWIASFIDIDKEAFEYHSYKGLQRKNTLCYILNGGYLKKNSSYFDFFKCFFSREYIIITSNYGIVSDILE